MLQRAALWLIGFYQRRISPFTPPSCRFHPTCSHYTYQAIKRFGLLHGLGLAFWRICRCHPFCKGGYDPVPEGEPKPERETEPPKINVNKDTRDVEQDVEGPG